MGSKTKNVKSIFPQDFLWGASTSSHQVEGGNINDWSVWEKKTAEERVRHLPSWYKFPENLLEEASDPLRRVCGDASDSFNRWRDDIRVLKDMELNSYRFSVEWSSIFPEKGVVSEEGLKYYRNLIDELKKNGIEPVLTCWHWTLPLWVEREGGLLAKKIMKYFGDYFKVLAENFGHDVKYWITINEPDTVAAASYITGAFPPNHKNILESIRVYFIQEVKIHKIGYKIIKEVNPDAMVSVAENVSVSDPYDNKPWNRIAAFLWHFFESMLFLRLIEKQLDYIGFNFYFYNKVGVNGQRNDNDKVSDIGWWMRPDMIYQELLDLNRRFNLPILITENGVADAKDQYRKWWLDETFEAMRKAIVEGVNLIGYMHWSLLDNFEWAEGFWPKFGLAEVDPKTFNRKIRPSGYYYRDLIKQERGKYPLEMV